MPKPSAFLGARVNDIITSLTGTNGYSTPTSDTVTQLHITTYEKATLEPQKQ